MSYRKNAWLGILIAVLLHSCQEKNQTNTSVDNNPITIIGGGLMGSAAAYYLAKSGNKVVLYEKQDSIYTSGSSQGVARIARSSNRGNDIWSYMHNTTVDEVSDLINYLQNEFPDRNIDIADIYTTNPVSYVGRMSIHDKLLASLIRQKITYKLATTPEEGRTLFDVNLPEGVLLQKEYNEHSGTINPQALIQYLHLAFKSLGGDVRYEHKIDSLTRDGEQFKFRVTDSKNNITSLSSKRVISAAGPYTGVLLSEVAPYFNELINPQRVFLAFYKVDNVAYANLSKSELDKLSNSYPVINSSKGTRDGSFFSMIEYYDDGVPVIKIGGHFQRSEIEDLDQVWEKELNKNEKSWALESTLSYFKLLNLPLGRNDLKFDHGYSCVYSLTETEVPIISPIQSSNGGPNPNFVVLGGMSGVGAKGAMTYGMIGADHMLQSERSDTMYQHVRKLLGYDRIAASN